MRGAMYIDTDVFLTTVFFRSGRILPPTCRLLLGAWMVGTLSELLEVMVVLWRLRRELYAALCSMCCVLSLLGVVFARFPFN